MSGTLSRFRVGPRLIGFVALVFAVGLVLAALRPAEASAFDNMYKTANYNPDCFDGTLNNGHFCQTDNAYLRWYAQYSISSSGYLNIYDVLTAPFQSTDLNVVYDDTPSHSGSAETDIIYQQGSLPGTFIGYTWCNDAVSSLRCDQHSSAIRLGACTLPGAALAGRRAAPSRLAERLAAKRIDASRAPQPAAA